MAGSSMPTSIAMIAITTKSSTSVNALRADRFENMMGLPIERSAGLQRPPDYGAQSVAAAEKISPRAYAAPLSRVDNTTGSHSPKPQQSSFRRAREERANAAFAPEVQPGRAEPPAARRRQSRRRIRP